MSKDRARRRDEREQAAAVRRVAAQRRRARVERRQDRRRALAPVAPRLGYRKRLRRQEGILARRRRAQNGVILCLILASQMVVWLLTDDWRLRVTAALLAVIATPVFVTVVLDRRP
jgi:hypothetical protein